MKTENQPSQTDEMKVELNEEQLDKAAGGMIFVKIPSMGDKSIQVERDVRD